MDRWQHLFGNPETIAREWQSYLEDRIAFDRTNFAKQSQLGTGALIGAHTGPAPPGTPGSRETAHPTGPSLCNGTGPSSGCEGKASNTVAPLPVATGPGASQYASGAGAGAMSLFTKPEFPATLIARKAKVGQRGDKLLLAYPHFANPSINQSR